ncbi:MAG: energy transducer TonB [Muribaculaceae bacterium]|nr:energy transducer TonB [Muribaculaceae bacterium]
MLTENYTQNSTGQITRAGRALVSLLGVLVCLLADAQVSHVTICNPSAPSGKEYLDVYEFDYVDVQPQFPGGESALINYVNKTREYPYEAYHKKIQGRVLCSFIVGTDGKVSNAKVIRGASDETLNREALRVIRLMPKWSVGKVAGTAVPVRVVLPIAFRL